ncbi:MAG: tRNA pseudouridine(38-40) synthase TruA [Synergistaceae bacterium]
MKYAAKISYDGSYFYGWQTQKGFISVQESLEKGLTKINGNIPVVVAGAGRTDTGVHAKAQVCSFEMQKEWDTTKMLLAINSNISKGMSVMEIAKVSEEFHARFDAKEREYRYFIWNANTIYPHIKPYACWLKQTSYNWDRAKEACKYLIGEHDFSAFCRQVDKPKNTIKTIYSAEIIQTGNMLTFRIIGSGFLTNMVRIIIGNLEQIARGIHEPEWIKELYSAGKTRGDCGRTFPPNGLFLWKINYGINLWNTHQNNILMYNNIIDDE